jgi:hypothetical protein
MRPVLVTRGREILILGDQCRTICGARVRRAQRSLSEQKILDLDFLLNLSIFDFLFSCDFFSIEHSC